ncbi:hypothetical protein M433DRAFT_24571 [Acidomyces richmondensis BFW]|nr:MAG: hypothetical protein FE78DRAFT_40167 [Acidomyces sp. 'richmondensis']KYG45422.1 hypothetical protein M433DRAFT_24571 [Acidomyces richmondensis BFW]
MASKCTINELNLNAQRFLHTNTHNTSVAKLMSNVGENLSCIMHFPSEGVSILRPHHLTKIVYPDLSILNPPTESLMLPPIQDAWNRYEPSSFFQDGAIMSNTDRGKLAETSFFVVTEAVFADKGTYFDTKQEALGMPERLARDMERISNWNGETWLNAATYQVVKEGKEFDRIRIQRNTLFQSESFFQEEHAIYDITMKEFDDLETNEPRIRSIEKLGHLCHSVSDRAVLHINAQLLRQSRPYLPPEEWKKPRQPRYEKVLCTFAQPVNFLGLSPFSICEICANSFDKAGHDAMVLICGRNHMLCKQCLLQICQTGQVEHAQCPFCRTNFFENDKVVEWLKHGVFGKDYVPDDEYSDYENFERSVSDLDKQHAEDNEKILQISSSTLVHTMRILFQGALLEPTTSTPQDLQPVRHPELTIVASTLERSLGMLEGAELPTNLVFKTLLNDIYQALVRMSLRSELRSLVKVHELEHLLESRCLRHVKLRPGFVEFVRRTVSRMLQFAHLRICRCQPSGYHSHGLREYFNPDTSSLTANM